MGKTMTTEEEGHDYDEDDLPDYSVLKLANQSAQLFSDASDGMSQYTAVPNETANKHCSHSLINLFLTLF